MGSGSAAAVGCGADAAGSRREASDGAPGGGHDPAAAIVPERSSGGVRPAGAVDGATGVRRRRPEEQPSHRGLGPPEPRDRAEHQLLMQLGRASADVPAHQAEVGGLDVTWTLDVPGQDVIAESGGESLEPTLDPVDEGRQPVA
jgi:hypothetical protein